MGYKCNDCGNTESFFQTRDYTAYGWEENRINGVGEYEETVEDEETERDSGDVNGLKCYECESEDVEWIDEDQTEIKKNEPVTNWKKRVKK